MGDLWRDICENCDLGICTLLTLAVVGAARQAQDGCAACSVSGCMRITVKPFMDMSTMIEERLTQCCVHVGTRAARERHQCAPFCAVQAWPPLSAQRLSAVASEPRVRLPLEVIT